ncbi:MAG: methylated-DNA--[protein]-cysteine S-methyltransferase [Rhodoglobus sp.]|nr:methylated-DNA--[protein]-cysteine S-methyltransferase [Rhodoglobus sp.]
MHTASPAAPIAAATLTGPDDILRMDSPIGRIEVTADEGAITSLSIERQGHLPWEELPERTSDVLEAARVQLDEYFRGERAEFDLPLRLVGTPFQRQVWQLLGEVPFGDVLSYGEIGRSTGRPTAGRAVGGAVGANPVPIIVPCHRVLASDGRITGYSGGNGNPTKVWLLDHEGIPHK